MKGALFIGAGCAVVLVGALVFSHASGNVDVPPSPTVDTHVAPTPVAQPLPPSRPMLKAELAVPPPPANAPKEQPVGAPPLPTAHIGAPPPPTSAAIEPPHEEQPLEASPGDRFKGESKELDYAERLASKPDATLEELRSATSVFSRCVELDQGNQRCNEGLERARLKLVGVSRSRRVEQGLETPRVSRDDALRNRLRPQ